MQCFRGGRSHSDITYCQESVSGPFKPIFLWKVEWPKSRNRRPLHVVDILKHTDVDRMPCFLSSSWWVNRWIHLFRGLGLVALWSNTKKPSTRRCRIRVIRGIRLGIGGLNEDIFTVPFEFYMPSAWQIFDRRFIPTCNGGLYIGKCSERRLASTNESGRKQTCVLFHLRDNPLWVAQGLGTSAVWVPVTRSYQRN